jgi:hypothetical protein
MSLKRLFMLAVGLCFAVNASAYMWYVPAADVDDALTSASAGDSIVITDSGTITDSLTINKQLYISALDGVRPVILNNLDFTADAAGSIFGSAVGGTIQFGNSDEFPTTPTTESRWFKISAGTGDFYGSLTLENLDVYGSGALLDSRRVLSSTATVTLNDVDYQCTDTARVAYLRWEGITNINQCDWEGMDQAVRIHDKNRGWTYREINVNNCYFKMGDFDSNSGVIHKTQNEPVRLSVENSVLVGANGIKLDEGQASVTVQNSVLVANGHTDHLTTTSQYYAHICTNPASALLIMCYVQTDYIINKNGALTAPWDPEYHLPSNIEVDYSDLISSGSAVLMQDIGTSNRTVLIKNSNLIALNSDRVVTATVNVGDSLTLDHCNVYGGSGQYGGEVAAEATLTAIQSEDPGYDDVDNDFVSRNTKYSNSNLLNKSIDSTPLGSYKAAWEMVPVELSTFSIQ